MRHRAFGLFGADTGVGTVPTLLVMPALAVWGGYRLVFEAALTAAVFPATLAMVGDVAHTGDSLGATTGLIGLSNLIGSMVAPWAFGALLDAFGTAPGEHGYLAGFATLACFALAGAAAAAAYLLVRPRAAAAEPSRS